MRCEDCKKEVELGKIWPDFNNCNICGGGRHWAGIGIAEPELDNLVVEYYLSSFEGTFEQFIIYKKVLRIQMKGEGDEKIQKSN